ncbi:MAG: sugar phosphate isomerase/epimerase [Kiritimatiellaeota bacterium]|nr:sugar phosphate isomerase/epimerase [Kiritimatiellota bacterium]
MIKLGCGTVTFRELPLEEAMRRIAGAGYEYVEPQATAPFCPHVNPWKDDPDRFRRLVADFGFKGASALWAPHGAIIPTPESVRGITQAIRWAAEAAIPVVNAGDGKKPRDLSDDDALELMRDRLARILEVAAECRVFLAVEPHGTFSLTADGLKKIMALSDSEWLGINYDAANVHRATYVETVAGAYSWTPYGRRQDEVATLKAVVERVVHFHVKDVRGAECVVLGRGEVDNGGCIDVLREHGYDGVLSLETEGGFGPDEAQHLIEESRKYLLDLLG